MESSPGLSPEEPEVDQQALLYARDVARLQTLRRTYERLLPMSLDPKAPEAPAVVRTATALLTDLSGFTRLGERFADDPTALLAVLNEHLGVVVHAVTRCGGVVEKFVGDGILGTFGARAEMPDHHERAVAAALGIVGANEALNRRRSQEWGFRLDVRVTAAAGALVVGNIGPPERSEMGVLGDPINVASRLVARAKPGEILLDASVYSGLAGALRADLLGRSAVRGRTGKLSLYRIDLLGRNSGKS